MVTLLLRHAAVLVTMDDRGTEIPDGAVLARDGWIEQVGPTAVLPSTADEVVDLTGHVLLPGLVNTHHHFTQTLTRAVPGAQDANLFDWLTTLYPLWGRITPDHVRVSTTVALAELALSGCTTAADHTYLWPGGARLDDQVDGAEGVGLRVHLSRGSMSVGESSGGLPPDDLVEDEREIISDSERVVARFHDPAPGAMLQVALAPCSPFTVSPELMTDSASLARGVGVRLHTHLAETVDEERYCRERFGVEPVDLAEQIGWLGDDVWWAHAVHVDDEGARRMAETGTGVAHCPTSNMRLGSGIAPLRRYLEEGAPVGLGVDGSASNDGGGLLAEARQAMLLARLAAAPDGPLLAARTALRLATAGGAAVLGRQDLGSLEPGKAADLMAVRLDHLEYAGAGWDPIAALVLCAPVTIDRSWVHGRPVVVDGELTTVDVPALIESHSTMAASLAG
jgi:cytosine/adenosine deaminase-related metal-dependent hydrolase